MKKLNIILMTTMFWMFFLSLQSSLDHAYAEPSMAEYTCYPIFQTNAVEPNILIILDNSGSMNFQAYIGDYDHSIKYYGYFEPYKKYSYASNLFSRDPSGLWDGNFLNWMCMRRIDVARKVLMGGLATSRTGGGNQTNIGETPAQSGRDFIKNYQDVDDVTPFSSSTTKNYLVSNGYFYVDGNPYTIKVSKDMVNYPDEAYNFVDGNISGVLQKVGDKARWGNEYFNFGTGNNESGGSIVSTIGTNMITLITDLQNTACDTWTPLGEAYYVAMQYFKQESEDGSLDYPNGAVPCANVGDDPYYSGEFISCADAFVILLTDGASTMDQMVPAMYKDYADAYDYFVTHGTSYADSGSDYLKDIALYARATDLRSATIGKTDLEGDQNMLLYTIYAFGDDPNARNMLKEAAKNGGFEDRNGNDVPDLKSEWDKDDDDNPDTYYEADNGYALEAQLIRAINDILERAASGTSVSVLATSGEGEGNLVQAYYRPRITVGIEDIEWLGFLQSLWVDKYGYLREDTNANHILDPGLDKVITYFVDAGSGDTRIRRYDVSPENPYPDLDPDACIVAGTCEEMNMEEIHPLWEAGSLLAQRSADDRNIFTYIDKDNDGFPDSTTDGILDSSNFNDVGEVVAFNTGTAAAIKPFLGVRDDTSWSYLGGTHDDRVTNLIQWIRGNDILGLRERTADWDGDGDEEVWKFGDIVHSTPVSISRPPDYYDLIYSDRSYGDYIKAYKDRETIVYVGANDGMLHAFTSWKYNRESETFTKPASASMSENIGDELWAFIPQSLLPHLKWLPDTDYTHVYYVDMEPKVFDAKIFPDGIHYADADTDDDWGTILLAGFYLGGGDILVEDDFDYDGVADEIRSFSPTYVCMDVTDPRNPRLLWERSYQNLERSSSFPAIVKVQDKWFAVFGSGPSDCNGTSSQNGYVYVVDLKTGDAYPNRTAFPAGTTDGWLFQTDEDDAFMSPPVPLDKNLNYNVDAVYVGETWDDSPRGWAGKLYKITIPWVGVGGDAEYGDIGYSGSPDEGYYIDSPNDAANPWRFHLLFEVDNPITASPTVSVDEEDNTWVYFGTGRYLSTEDKTDTATQYLFGIKDPFFNQDHQPEDTDPIDPTPCKILGDEYGCFNDNYYHNNTSYLVLDESYLMDADPYLIAGKNAVYDGGSLITDYNGNALRGEWGDLLTLSRSKDGWKRTLTTLQERMVTKPGILGGTLFATSFVPNDDVCGYGGSSFMYGLYFKTGTAYFKRTFVDVDVITYIQDHISLGEGKTSEVGLHVGRGHILTGFTQQSTGKIRIDKLDTAYSIKSGLISWMDQ